MGKSLFALGWLAFVTVSCSISKTTVGGTKIDRGFRDEGSIDRVAQTFDRAAIDYFLEIALGAEFGDSPQRIRKWTEDIRIGVSGLPTEGDRETLETVVSELNASIETLEITFDETAPNIEIYFVPEAEFSQYEPNYVPTNLGFVWLNWNGNDECYFARILISTTDVSQQKRSHLIREELTQSLGLLNDSYEYPDSIFYQDWSEVTRYTNLDRSVIEILYDSRISPGMTRQEILDLF